jgi:hypothetical protein
MSNALERIRLHRMTFPSGDSVWIGRMPRIDPPDEEVEYVRADTLPAVVAELTGELEQATVTIDALTATVEYLRAQAPVYPEPDWSDAPERAIWRAVNADGTVAWYTHEPTIYTTSSRWYHTAGDWWQFGSEHVELPIGCDWRLTKRSRLEE